MSIHTTIPIESIHKNTYFVIFLMHVLYRVTGNHIFRACILYVYFDGTEFDSRSE